MPLRRPGDPSPDCEMAYLPCRGTTLLPLCLFNAAAPAMRFRHARLALLSFKVWLPVRPAHMSAVCLHHPHSIFTNSHTSSKLPPLFAEHMGKARVTCEGDCKCLPSVLDGHHTERSSQLFLHTFYATQGQNCYVVVTGGQGPLQRGQVVRVVTWAGGGRYC